MAHQEVWKRKEFKSLGQISSGQGSFGRAWIAQHKQDYQLYAIKQINVDFSLRHFAERSENSFEIAKEKMEREVENMKKIRSTFVVRYHSYWYEDIDPEERSILKPIRPFGPFNYGVSPATKAVTDLPLDKILISDDDDPTAPPELPEPSFEGSSVASFQDTSRYFLFIQMEYCNGGTLRNFMEKNSSFTDARMKEIPRIVNHLLSGLAAIHKENIVHRDIKPSNIFCTKQFPWSSELIWKIGDFGLSTKTIDKKEDESDNPTFGGDTKYQAPEDGEELSEKADIYSMGIIFLELIYAKPLANLLKSIGDFPTKSLEIMVENAEIDIRFFPIAKIVQKMVKLSPAKRPTAQELLDEFTFPINWGVQGETLPLSRDQFYGRNAILEKMEDVLINEILKVEAKDGLKIIITDGKNGTGRLELLKQFAQMVTKEYNCNVIWLDGTTPSILEKQLLDLAFAIDAGVTIRQHGELLTDYENLMESIMLQIEKEYCDFSPTVIIIHDVQQLCDIDKYVKQLQRENILLVISVNMVNALITCQYRGDHSCNKIYERWLPLIEEQIDVAGLDEESSLSLIPSLNTEKKIVSELKGLPIALQQAELLATTYKYEANNFLEKYVQASINLKKICNDSAFWKGFKQDRPPFFVTPPWDEEEKCMAAMVLMILNHLDSEARILLEVLAFLDDDGISVEMLEQILKGTIKHLKGEEDSGKFSLSETLDKLKPFLLVKRVLNGRIVLVKEARIVVQLKLISEGRQKDVSKGIFQSYNIFEAIKVGSVNTLMKENGGWSIFSAGNPHQIFCDFKIVHEDN